MQDSLDCRHLADNASVINPTGKSGPYDAIFEEMRVDPKHTLRRSKDSTMKIYVVGALGCFTMELKFPDDHESKLFELTHP